jgi:hypothetical protein
MTDSHTVDLAISIEPPLELGVYANAFRVLDGDLPSRVFLEFLLYSPTLHRALVVARVRVSPKLLPVMINQLRGTLALVEMTPSAAH